MGFGFGNRGLGLDSGLELRIGIGDWNRGMELGIGIGDLDLGLRLGLGIAIEYFT